MPDSLKSAFELVLKKNYWGDADSRSGPGSNLEQTKIIRSKIPELLVKYKVAKMLDAPCGDLFWMSQILYQIIEKGISYHGADIVPEIIAENEKRFKNAVIRFSVIDLTKGKIPAVDIILTRDCFIHLSYANILSILASYVQSGSTYLLASTYTNAKRKNTDVKGFYLPGRALNLENFPFYLGKPIDVIVEGCTEGEGTYSDKSLGLWKIKNINLNKIRFLVVMSVIIDLPGRAFRKIRFMIRNYFG